MKQIYLSGPMTNMLDLSGKHAQAIKERDALQQRLNDADQWNDELLGLLRKAAEFEVGESDSEDWQYLLSQISLQLTSIRSLKPAEPAKDEHICTGCGSKGWTASCAECVPY